MGQFLSIDFFNLYSSSKLLASDSENAFVIFENLFRVICLCLFIIFLFIVCHFVQMYPTVCVCGVIKRSYFWLSLSQLCKTMFLLLVLGLLKRLDSESTFEVVRHLLNGWGRTKLFFLIQG